MEETMETTVDTEMESTQEDLFDWGEAGQGEEQQEQKGQHTGHQIGRGVPPDLLELLAHQGQQLPHPEAA